MTAAGVASVVGVLEIGGTHVSAAAVDTDGWLVGPTARLHLDGDAGADELIAQFAAAAARVDVPSDAPWGIAMPDPFDYDHGIGLFEGVGKFTSLNGVDVRAALTPALSPTIGFVNDADAFLLGEWTDGAAAGTTRCAGLTLGTGIGSAWLVDGVVVDPGMPPGGRMHRMSFDGAPLEDTVSRRAIRRAFTAAGGDPQADVREIAEQARAGLPLARRVLDTAMRALGQVVGDCVCRFGAEVLVVGGSMSASWDVLGPPFRVGAQDSTLPRVELAADAEAAPFVGAAVAAVATVRTA
ncbi:ROK family protein [uncultured Jatrophihabitans sp.]|uniref:ROK family protein n=1 Tax=uncultured Jatrophihabitans sp. TaxID=1610747 RepID=UPI0035CC1663